MHAVATLSIAGLSRRHLRLSVPRLERAFVSGRRWRASRIAKIRRIQIVLAGQPDQVERGIARMRYEDGEAHRARSGALPSHPMPDCLPGVLRHQGLELTFCPLMVEEGLPRVAEQGGELGPGVRSAHVHNTDGLDPWPR